jgi:hypothetical protein
VDSTEQLWLPNENYHCEDQMLTFLDFDSDGDADLLTATIDCPDRLYANDGSGRLQLFSFIEENTRGTMSLAVADLNGDHRFDVVLPQGEQGFG